MHLASGTPLLELAGIGKRFGHVAALDRLNATIAAGEFVTVVGASGCGKSTLFNIVAGLEEPEPGGMVRFRGETCPASALLGQVAFMPQRDLLLPWRTVIDNAILAIEIEGKKRSQARAPRPRHAARVRPDRIRAQLPPTSSAAACASASP